MGVRGAWAASARLMRHTCLTCAACHSLAEEREVREVLIMGMLFSGLLELRNLEFCPCFEGNPYRDSL